MWRLPGCAALTAEAQAHLARAVADYLLSSTHADRTPPQSETFVRDIAHSILVTRPSVIDDLAAGRPVGAIAQFVRRTAQRATPRAAFAATCVAQNGPVQRRSVLRLSGAAAERLVTALCARLDANATLPLARHFSVGPADGFSSIWGEAMHGDTPLVRIRQPDPEERLVLDTLRRPHSLEQLTAALSDAFPEHTVSHAVRRLRDDGVVVPALRPIPTDLDLTDWTISTLDMHAPSDPLAANMRAIATALARIKTPDDATLPSVLHMVEALLPGTPGPKPPVTFDTARIGPLPQVAPKVLRDVQACVDTILHNFVGPNPVHAHLHQAMLARFDEGRHSLRRIMAAHFPNERTFGQVQTGTGADRFVARQAAENPGQPIDLSPFCQGLPKTDMPAGADGAALFLAAQSVGKDDIPLAELLGLRLGSADDYVARLTGPHGALNTLIVGDKVEGNGDDLTVDLLYEPSQSARDIVLRPRGAEAFLCLNGSGALDRPGAIAIDDIAVIVTEAAMWAVHMPTKRRIRFRLATAHDWMHPLQPRYYRLLGALAAPLSPRLPCLPQDETRLHHPELRLGRVIVTPERWWPSPAERQHLASLGRDTRLTCVQRMTSARALPRHVFVGRGDRRVPMDLECDGDMAALAAELAQTGTIIERRYPALGTLSMPDGHTVTGAEVMVRFSASHTPAPAAKAALTEPLDPTYEPVLGSILSLKIYGRQDRLLALLLDVLAPTLAQLETRALLAQWFFIRYADPDTHFRLRLFASQAGQANDLLRLVGAVLDRLMRDDQIDRWTVDPYRREWARYGGQAAMPHAETLFCADSQHAVRTIRALVAQGGYTPDAVRPAAVALLLAWHHALGLDKAASQTLLKRMCDRLRTATGAARGAHRAETSAVIAALRSGDMAGGATLDAGAARRLAHLAQTADFTTTIHDIATSLIHMSLNRLLPSWSREEEHRIYLAAHTALHACPQLWDQVAPSDHSGSRALAG
ncbi:hypothetical protein BWR18_06450 [Tateyamaria omphalii]|uniref:Lantibiotic dehydratase N-terminal domain-containing protein n=1 Tax=Tateyamaria omphalii TaxID=299262 RepID=A0A1P8MTT0_9RHOB|nr:hypothetical protein BWR18_06450 [Tateyamaria omphalii]